MHWALLTLAGFRRLLIARVAPEKRIEKLIINFLPAASIAS